MTQDLEKPSVCFVASRGIQVVRKQASSGLRRDLLENEIRVLEQISTLDVPAVVASHEDGPILTLEREFIDGTALSDTPLPLWPDLLAKLEHTIQKVHALGIVHGDLKPSNLIVSGPDIRAIDWEHALPIGAQIADLPFRAVSLGTSDPNLIWGRGTVSEEIDRYSIARMYQMAAARKQPIA